MKYDDVRIISGPLYLANTESNESGKKYVNYQVCKLNCIEGFGDVNIYEGVVIYIVTMVTGNRRW